MLRSVPDEGGGCGGSGPGRGCVRDGVLGGTSISWLVTAAGCVVVRHSSVWSRFVCFVRCVRVGWRVGVVRGVCGGEMVVVGYWFDTLLGPEGSHARLRGWGSLWFQASIVLTCVVGMVGVVWVVC